MEKKNINEKGNRINNEGVEVVEVDAKQLVKAMRNNRLAVGFMLFSVLLLILYSFDLINSVLPLEIKEHFYYVGSIIILFGVGIILSKTKWQPKVIEDAKVIVKLPKSALKSLEAAESVSGLITHKEHEKLDVDGDGEILVSEIYTKTEDEVEKEIKDVDSGFSIVSFKNFAKSVFVVVQNAWSNSDYKMLRPFQSDTLYHRQKLRIEDMIADNFINRRTHIRVKGILLKDFRVEGDYEVLVVMMTANMKMTHPEVACSTDNGDYPYVLKFMRNRGVKTRKNADLSTSNCSNCGAAIEVDDKGVCKYCGTSLVSGEHDWVLADIKNIKLLGM